MAAVRKGRKTHAKLIGIGGIVDARRARLGLSGLY
jgi:hypothetical protein